MEQPNKNTTEIKLEQEMLEIGKPVVLAHKPCFACGETNYNASAMDAVYCTNCGAFYIIGPFISNPVAEIVDV